MRYLLMILLLAMSAACGWAGLPLLPPEVERPRILTRGSDVQVPCLPWRWMTWNLQWFPGHHPQAHEGMRDPHIHAVERWVGVIRPQVAIFQEVLDCEALVRATPAYPWRVMTDFQRAGDEDGKLPPQNVAIASQWPWEEVWEIDFHRLPLTRDRPVRGLLGVRFRDEKSRAITIYGIHLKSNRGGREASSQRRERAMEYLRWDWRRRGLDPLQDAILVGGDFNCSSRNLEFTEETIGRLLHEGWCLADASLGWPAGATVKADPDGRFEASDFDHFLLSPGYMKWIRGKTPQARVLQRADIPSDHYPMEMSHPMIWRLE